MRRIIRNGTVTLEYVTSTTNSAGVTYYYFRRPRGPRVPLGTDPGSSEFMRRYLDAKDAAPARRSRAEPGSIAAVVEAVKASPKWKTFSDSYRGPMDRHFSQIVADYGAAPIAGLRAYHIEKNIEPLTPSVARHRLKAWSLICRLAKRQRWSGINAASGVERPAVPKTDGFLPWSIDDVGAFRARWPIGTIQRRAFELLYWTAARTNDAVRLCPTMIDSDGVLTFTQSKTGAPANVPWHCALPDWAQGMEPDRQYLHASLADGVFTFLETDTGKARSIKGLSNLITAAAKEAGLTDRTAHGLRKSRLNRIAEASATSQAIMAWGGHSSLKEADVYIRHAERRLVIMGTEQKREKRSERQ